MRFFVVHYFWSKILLFSLCGCNNSKTNFILQLQEQKCGRRQTQYFRTLCENLCTWLSWCCPLQPFQMRYFVVLSFWSKILIFSLCGCNNSKMNFILQPQEQKSGRRLAQCSSPLSECLCTWLSWCCPLQPFQMRFFVVHFDQKSCYFCVPTTLARQFYSATTGIKKW